MLLWGWKRILQEFRNLGLDISPRTAIYWAHRYQWPIRWISRSPVLDKEDCKIIVQSMLEDKATYRKFT